MTQPPPEPTTPDRRMVAAMVAVALLGALMAVTAAIFWGLRMAISVATGAAIATSNLYFLSRIVGAMVRGGGGAAAWSLLAMLKMIFLFGGILLLISWGVVDAIGLVVGYGALPIGIAISAVVSDKVSPDA